MVIIVPKFTKADIARMLGEKRQRIYDAMLNALIRVGEQFVNDARSQDTYKDQTGNLRSSIGYVILYNGKQIVGNFEGRNEHGKSKAQGFINDIRGKFGSGFAIIVVAGMDYAAAVEARGLDVLTNSSIPAVDRLKTSIASLAKKLT